MSIGMLSMSIVKKRAQNRYNKDATIARKKAQPKIVGGMKMKSIWTWIASLFYAYGRLGAGMVSFRGICTTVEPSAILIRHNV